MLISAVCHAAPPGDTLFFIFFSLALKTLPIQLFVPVDFRSKRALVHRPMRESEINQTFRCSKGKENNPSVLTGFIQNLFHALFVLMFFFLFFSMQLHNIVHALLFFCLFVPKVLNCIQFSYNVNIHLPFLLFFVF